VPAFLDPSPSSDLGRRNSVSRREAFCAIFSNLNVQDALAALRRHESALRAHGVAHVAVFGSVARGKNRLDSGLDILVAYEPGAVMNGGRRVDRRLVGRQSLPRAS
jgi:Nucleotidyltransferase domain